MRTSFLTAALFGLFAAGCAGELSGTGDDQQAPENCGNGAVDSGESCDDSNTAGGDGCSSSCQVESNGGTPRVAGSIDKMTIATELGKTELVSLNLTSVDGFAGAATIAASLVDAANAPIPGVTVEGPASVTLLANGSTPVQFSIKVPTTTTNSDVAGTLKFDVTSSAAPIAITSNVNVAAVYTVTYAAGTGATINNHPGVVTGPVTLKRGAKIRFKNADTITHQTHGNGGMQFAHEPDGAGLPGGTYELNTTVVAPGTSGPLGCHSHGGDTYATFTIQ
ncbi:MAG TPA: hypothetical protein VK427_08720 [Kofleriaceae bacterium]|nr:hypothetical protein [Kofleriaceae bacterium]